MTVIPCTGDFWLASPVFEGDKVVSIHTVPIIAWADKEDEGILYPIPCDEPWIHDDDEIVVRDGIGYSFEGLCLKTNDEMIEHFQGQHDRKKSWEAKKA